MSLDEPTSVYIGSMRNHFCNIFRVLGLWNPFQKPKWMQVAYSSYSVVFLSVFSIIYTILMVVNIFFLTDFADLTNRLFMSLTEAALAIKVLNFFFNNREWQQILTEIESFRIKSMKEETIIRRRTRIIQIVVMMYYIFPNLTVHAFGVTPLFNGAKSIPFSGWYPGLDWENNRRDYWIVYVYQYFGMFVTANLNVTVDSYYCFVMHILSAQVNIFGKRLSSMQVNEAENSTQQTKSDLIQQIHTHQRLNALFEMIQRNLQWAYFFQIVLSSIVICSVVKELARVGFSYFLKSFSERFLFNEFHFHSRHHFLKKRLFSFQWFSRFLHL